MAEHTVYRGYLTSSAITLIMALGFQLYMGNSGILNWSYVGYVGIGAFTSAIFSMTPALKAMQIPTMYPFLIGLHLPFPLALVAGALVAMIVAAVVAWPLMRLSDSVGAITQFALLIVINVILSQWSKVTNGPRTFTLGGTRLTTLWVMGIAVIVIIAVLFQGILARTEAGPPVTTAMPPAPAVSISSPCATSDMWQAHSSAARRRAVFALYPVHHRRILLYERTFHASLHAGHRRLYVCLGRIFRDAAQTLPARACASLMFLTRSGFEASGTTEIVVAVLMVVFLSGGPTASPAAESCPGLASNAFCVLAP